MATIQIRHVPEDVYATIRQRAQRAGQSLQQYLLAEVIELARTRPVADIVADVEAEIERDPRGFSKVSAVNLIRGDRDAR